MSSSNVCHALPPACAAAAHDVHYHCVASLTFLVWDYIVTLDDEVQYIWTMRNESPFKWAYCFMRHGVILAHVTHNSLFEALVNGGNSPMICKMWHSYIVVFTQTVQTLLELILASRVCALYNRSGRIAFLLAILILAEVGGTIRMLCLENEPDFYGTCLLQAVDENGLTQSILGFSVHCTLIALTLFKYLFALRAGWGRTPLVSLVVRDNSMVYATIVFLLASVVIANGVDNVRGVIVFYWATALTSFSGCRMIVGMERFARQEISPPDQPIFTSEFSLGTLDSGSRHDRSAL